MANDPTTVARLLDELLNRLSPNARAKDKAEGKADRRFRQNSQRIQPAT